MSGVRFLAHSMDKVLRDALKFLPHGPEFRFLDELTVLDPGKSGAGEYRVRGDETFLRGHFPGDPMMPGVLLIEAAAQLAGVIAQSDLNLTPLRELKLTAVRSAKILGTARSGETIRFEAHISARMENLIHGEATARVGERLLLRTEVVLSGAA